MDDMTRRGFIAAGAVVAAPYILKSQDKAGTKNPIIGEGEYKYECIHDWGNLPSNIKYGNTHGVGTSIFTTRCIKIAPAPTASWCSTKKASSSGLSVLCSAAARTACS